MSYILDALKKSEQKRPPGQVPDVFTVQGPQPAGKSRWSLVGVAGAAAVIGAAVVIVGWAWRSGRETPEPAAPAPAATTAASGAKTTAPAARGMATQGRANAPAPGGAVTAPPIASTPARVSPATVHVASAPAPRREAVPAAPPLVPLSEVPKRPTPAASTALRGGTILRVAPTPEAGAVDAAAAPAAAQPSPAMPASEAPQPAVPEAQPPAPAPPAVPAPVAVPAPAPLPSSIAPPPAVNPATPLPVVTPRPVPIETAPSAPEPEAPPADGRVVGIEDLPQDLRATLAKFSVSGHVWSEEPGLRLLTVNDHIVREGQDAAPGVRLEQITQDGAVFSLRGWRFRMSGF